MGPTERFYEGGTVFTATGNTRPTNHSTATYATLHQLLPANSSFPTPFPSPRFGRRVGHFPPIFTTRFPKRESFRDKSPSHPTTRADMRKSNPIATKVDFRISAVLLFIFKSRFLQILLSTLLFMNYVHHIFQKKIVYQIKNSQKLLIIRNTSHQLKFIRP